MLRMMELPWGEIGAPAFEHELTDDLLVEDGGFDNKPPVVLKKGQVIKMKNCQNYGIVQTPEIGIYRY